MERDTNSTTLSSQKTELPNKREKNQTLAKPARPRRVKRWLHPDGRHKSTEELKQETVSWSAKDWEAYLESLEHPQTEVLLAAPGEIENLLNEDSSKIFQDLLQKNGYPRFSRRVEAIVGTLSPRQREILTMVYVEEIPRALVAKQLGVRIQTVEVHEKRALQRVAEKLQHFDSGVA